MEEEDEELIEREMEEKVDIDVMVEEEKKEEKKVEIYKEQRMDIDKDKREERGYMDMIEGRIGMKDEMVEKIEEKVD